MDPLTHGLASLALGRAGLNRTTRLATPMLLVSGLAADLDWVTRFGGARAFLVWHRTATHSLIGAVAIALIVSGAFWSGAVRRNRGGGNSSKPLRFAPALAVCAVGASVHVLLDLTNSYGVRLLWPFSHRWFAWDLANALDPLLLTLLLLGVLVPALFRLITEEIGAGARRAAGGGLAIAFLSLAAIYFGGRALLHERAIALLNSRTYREEAPLRVAALPEASPFDWAGVVDTREAIEHIDVPLLPGARFDPDSAHADLKPADADIIQRAQNTGAAQLFLQCARFPFAIEEKVSSGYLVIITDERFAANPLPFGNPVAVIVLDERLNVTSASFRFE